MKTMKIELELPNMTAMRLRGICRQICTSHKSTPRYGDGRSTIYGLTKSDIRIVEYLIHAITDAELDNSVPRFLQKYNV